MFQVHGNILMVQRHVDVFRFFYYGPEHWAVFLLEETLCKMIMRINTVYRMAYAYQDFHIRIERFNPFRNNRIRKITWGDFPFYRPGFTMLEIFSVPINAFGIIRFEQIASECQPVIEEMNFLGLGHTEFRMIPDHMAQPGGTCFGRADTNEIYMEWSGHGGGIMERLGDCAIW